VCSSDLILILEIAAGIIGAIGIIYAFLRGNFGIIPILCVYTVAYLFNAKVTCDQSIQSAHD